jgi:hypothetical protein
MAASLNIFLPVPPFLTAIVVAATILLFQVFAYMHAANGAVVLAEANMFSLFTLLGASR